MNPVHYYLCKSCKISWATRVNNRFCEVCKKEGKKIGSALHRRIKYPNKRGRNEKTI